MSPAPCLGISPLPKDKCHQRTLCIYTAPVEPCCQIVNEAPQEWQQHAYLRATTGYRGPHE